MSKTIKIQIIGDSQDYKKGQIVELEEKQAINFLTNGKALKIHRKKPFSEIVTLSINETLSRTIITSLTVIISALALFVFGGDSINDFAFILLVGFGVGIYSTIFVATSLVVDWKGKGR